MKIVHQLAVKPIAFLAPARALTRVPLVLQRNMGTQKLPLSIREIVQSVPQEGTAVEVHGWVKSVRKFKNVAFLDVNDGTWHDSVMAVASPESVKDIQTGSSVTIVGEWVRSKGKRQNLEIKTDAIKVLGKVPAEYPLQKKYHTAEFIRSLQTLKFRTNRWASVLRTRSFVEQKLNEFFKSQSFTKVQPPLITSSDCEGAGELFHVESRSRQSSPEPFFVKETYLTVSTQLHLEVLAQSLNKVWTLSPSFRAEESDTNRHLSEFWMLEAEISFLDNVTQLTTFCEQMIKFVVNSVLANEDYVLDDICGKRSDEEKQEIMHRLQLLSQDWCQITYKEAIELLIKENKNWQYEPPVYGKALTTEQEKHLSESVLKRPVFVTHYPRDEKAFYMKLDIENTVECFDLLFPVIGELIGGSVRESDYDKLLAEMQRRNMKSESLQWYLDLRQNGTTGHGGFGMGLERFVAYLCNIGNIKDVIPFARTVGSCDC